MASGSVAGGTSSDCDGEEQEDPSASHMSDEEDAVINMDSLNLSENIESEPIGEEDELQAFRQQWQRELETTPARQKESQQKEQPALPLTDEEKAKQLFCSGVELERSGKLYEAIQHYKRAIQIVPDIETRLYENEFRAETPDEDEELEAPSGLEPESASEDEDAVEGEELAVRFQRILARKPALCQPELPTKSAHLSWLPYEVLLVIARWVVSAELDAAGLERLGAVCRGLYLLAREPDLWRALCVRTWGIECGSPRAGGFPSWRAMYCERPRLLLHGCYISKTTYLRHGENSFQDHLYRPWYLIEYYRYLRFFPEGLVLMWTTAEEPASSVALLRHRHARAGLGIAPGHYRLVGDKVVIVIKKCNSEKKPETTRFRARRKEQEQQEQTFHLELELRDVRGRRNWQLQWRRYAAAARDQWANFELTPGKFPPFAFSQVRAYTAHAHAPLSTPGAYSL